MAAACPDFVIMVTHVRSTRVIEASADADEAYYMLYAW